MSYNRYLVYLTFLMVPFVTIGCGGDGSLASSTGGDSTRATTPLTPLPAFLEDHITQCYFEEDDLPVSLVGYRGDLNSVTGLFCKETELTNLQGIDLLPALETVSLVQTGLQGIGELTNRDQITYLDLSGNPLQDFSALNTMIGIEQLDLTNTGINDLAPLVNLINLQTLHLQNNPLSQSNLIPLGGLSLQYLDLSNSGLSELSGIGTLDELVTLDLSENDLSNISELNNLKTILMLDLSNNELSDLAPLMDLQQLQTLWLHGNEQIICADLIQLITVLDPGVVKTQPSACDIAFVLNSDSPVSTIINNDSRQPPYGRIRIADSARTNNNIEIEKSDDDLIVRLLLEDGTRSVTFVGWYLDKRNQVGLFELPDGSEYIYDQLINVIPLTQVLSVGRDFFSGNSWRDRVLGLDGDDLLMGGYGQDILIGGRGDDILTPNSLTTDSSGRVVSANASLQSSTYIYNRGDGHDIIYSDSVLESRKGLIHFSDDITEEDISLYRDGVDLIFYFDELNSVTIDSWFAGSNYQLGFVQFGDEQSLIASEWVEEKGYVVESDIVTRSADDEILIGTPEDDILLGGLGEDIIIGGQGDDLIAPNTVTFDQNNNVRDIATSDTQDIIFYNLGDGNDQIYSNVDDLNNRGLLQFGDGITEDMISLQRNNNDLIFYMDPENSVTITGWFEREEYRIGELQFFGDAPVDASQWVANRPVTPFIDPNSTLPAFLQQHVNQCQFKEGETLVSLVRYQGDLSQVTELICRDTNLINLQGIENLTGLQKLSLIRTGLTEFSELTDRDQITHLTLVGNPLQDLSVLNSMDGIVMLNLNSTVTSDIANLSGLPNLRILYLQNNPLSQTDLSPLANLSLNRLYLSNSGVTNISTLSGLNQIKELYLEGNNIADINGLENLQSVLKLNLANNQLTSISSLGGLTQLKELWLNGNDQIPCLEIEQLKTSLNSGVIKTQPAACDNAFVLNSSSPVTTQIDNSLLQTPYDRIRIEDASNSNQNTEIEKQGNDLIVRLITESNSRSVTFLNWYLDSAHQVGLFELADGRELFYEPLLNVIPLTQVLSSNRDVFSGNDWRDKVFGSAGDDVLMGGLRSDILIGGPGDDILTPDSITLDSQGNVISVITSSQSDVFIYNVGDGNDTIYSDSTLNSLRGTIKFGEGVSETEINLIREGNDLVFYFDEFNSITINKWFFGPNYRIGTLQFVDTGSVSAAEWVEAKGYFIRKDNIQGTDNDDVIIGTPENDIILGGLGRDTLIGGVGDDIMTPNSLTLDLEGNVTSVAASESQDVFFFELGDGNDEIYSNVNELAQRGLLQFGDSITSGMITLQQKDNDLIFYIDPNNSVTIKGWFEQERLRMGQLQFSDGDAVDATQWVGQRPISQVQ